MECQELEGRSCLKQHPDHLRHPNLGQQSRRLRGKAVANSRKEMPVVKEALVKEALVKEALVMEAVVKETVAKEAVVKEAACSWKELDLKDEMASME